MLIYPQVKAGSDSAPTRPRHRQITATTAEHCPGWGLIKICGLTRAEDAAFCSEAGADWLGFIFHPQSPRYLSPAAAAAIDSGTAKRVGVFVRQSPDEILKIMELARLDLAQLHGGQDEAFIRRIGPEKVISVNWPEKYASADDFKAALKSAEIAAWQLLDAGGDGGGHGRTVDLHMIREISPPRPWLLAGGLNAEVISAIDPDGLNNIIGFDFNSGLEDAPGQKNKHKVRAAVAAARRFLEGRYL